MTLIAHRGNICKPIPKSENKPIYIDEALNLGYDVEVDIRYDKGWWLGHDDAQYRVTLGWLRKRKSKLWLHCKNFNALSKLSKLENYNFFWHQEDNYTITSQGVVWVYPNKELIDGCICVLPELGFNGKLNKCRGVCSDFIVHYR